VKRHQIIKALDRKIKGFFIAAINPNCGNKLPKLATLYWYELCFDA
jgi:hypothetical protein